MNLLRRSDWLRLRKISETECVILLVRDLVAFPPCSVCEQLKAVERSVAQWPPSAPVLLSDSRRRSDHVPWYGSSGRADRPMLWAYRQYPRLGARPREVGFGHDWRLLPSCPQPSPRAYPRWHPVRSSPLRPRKSPYQIRLALPQGGRAHRVRHNHVPGHCQLLTGARSPIDLLSVEQTISGRITSLTLIPARDVPTEFAPQHFGSVFGRSQQGAVMAKEGEGAVKTHRTCWQQTTVGGCLSRSSDSKRIWPRREGLHVDASFSSASYHLRSWLGRWSWADQPRLQGNLLCRKDWIQVRKIALSEWVILPVQEVAAYPWCTECERLHSGMCLEERRAKWGHVGWSPWYRCASKIDGSCTGRPDSSSDSPGRTRSPQVSRLIAGVFALGLTPSTRENQAPLVSAWNSSH